MMSKKAQSEIITTVLIILLVLAAIIIVWQVVMGVLNQGKTSVTEQQGCIGFSMNVALNTAKTTVTVIPNKAVSAYRVYVAGAQAGTDGGALGEFESGPVTVPAVATGAEISTAGKIGDQWCEGLNKITAP
ncbi:hypothetical protein J4218_06100 [Candidatus Pacearchaeota archaeon]|nr:hypothetical protein [Candidatus Pacearchaeota archaeon]